MPITEIQKANTRISKDLTTEVKDDHFLPPLTRHHTSSYQEHYQASCNVDFYRNSPITKETSFSKASNNGNINEAFNCNELSHTSPEMNIPSIIITKPQEEKPALWPQICGALVCASVHMSAGCILAYTSVTLPSLMDKSSTDIVFDQFQASVFSSIINIGAIVGSLLGSFIMTWLGQRSTILVCTPIGMTFWTTMAFSNSFCLMTISRTIQGVVLGVLIGCSSNYVIEIAHTSVRGRLTSLLALSIIIGGVLVSVVGSTSLNWRQVALICGSTSMLLPFIGMIFLPHSPRWLALKGRMTEARESLIFFRGLNYDVDTEMGLIKKQIEDSTSKATVWNQLKLLTNRSLAFRFFILSFLSFASQFTGKFTFIVYSVSIFESANVDINPYTSTIIINFVRIFGNVINMIVVDKCGRRLLLMIPLLLSGLCMLVMGFFFFFKFLRYDMNNFKYLPLITAMIFMIFAMMSHPIIMLLRGELMPNQVRPLAVSLTFCFFFGGNFGASSSYFYMIDTMGSHWTFWIYGLVSIIMAAITAFTIPETKGKSLEDIEELFTRKK